jgi:hypothetical protein
MGGQMMGGGMGGGGMGGGGMGGMGGGGMGGMGGGGGGFFSIPADRTIRVQFSSVCLEHGKANPTPSMKYKVVRPSDVSDKPELEILLKQIASGKIERGTAQAAAWSIASGKSWQELANEKWDHVGAPDEPYFSQQQLQAAQSLVAGVKAKAKEVAEQQARVDAEKTKTKGSAFTPRPAAGG